MHEGIVDRNGHIELRERPRVCFVVESGTDVRMVEGLARHFDLKILARRIDGGVEVSHPPAVTIPTIVGPGSRSAFARLVRSHLRRSSQTYDFVLVQGYGLAALAANLAARSTGTPTAMLVCSPVEAYYDCRRTNPQPGKQFRRWELGAQRLVACLNGRVGNRYIVLSEHLAGIVRRRDARARVDVVPLYGVDTDQFQPRQESRESIRERLYLPRTGSIILFSSRIAPEKDSETLLIAFRRLVDSGRDLWLLHRSGGYAGFLHDAERFGIRDRVIASDAVHPHRELPLQYQASDLCVQASREEGLGFSPLEALASGVPVVATAVGGLRETIRDGETGWSYPVGDAEALAACIAAALDDPVEAERRTANGRAMVLGHFEAKQLFQRMADLVRSGAK